jgi:hypothetical protein
MSGGYILWHILFILFWTNEFRRGYRVRKSGGGIQIK